jgi:2-polyprenyl-3-methyl-5-hydroxy-6-metoxy-1,4-benzoquinol methylase
VKSFGTSAPEAIRALYDEDAKKYDETRLKTPFQLRFDSTERKILRRYLSGFARVLEVGAGTGRLTSELLACSKHVTVVDISPGMLERLHQRFPQETNLDLHVFNVYDLESFPEYGQFDALLSMRMLPHIKDIGNVLRILKGAVRPGGMLMVDFWNRQSYRYLKKNGAGVYNNFVSYKEARQMIADAGLELISFEGAAFGFPWDFNLEFLSRTPFKRIAYSLIAICKRPSQGS